MHHYASPGLLCWRLHAVPYSPRFLLLLPRLASQQYSFAMSNPIEEEDVLRDLTSRRWTRWGAERKSHGSAVAAWDDSRAVITGGQNHDEAKYSALVYNKDTMETETLPSMLQARWCHAAVIVGGVLFVIGGYAEDLKESTTVSKY